MNVKIKKNILLSQFTTFKIGGPAKYFCEIKTLDELKEALNFAKKNKLEIFVLGGGSNLLISDKGFDGLVVKVSSSKFSAPAKGGQAGGSASGGKNSYIEAEMGVPLGKIVIETINKGLSGMEWAAGIPGTLGGAIRGNAGAFGGSMSNVIKSVSAVDLKTGNIKKFNNSECLFAYRESAFKKRNNLLIWSAELSLKKGNKKALKEKISETMRYRQSRHPLDYPSFGSAFKNIYDKKIIKKITEKFSDAKENMEKWGNKIPAAYLVDKCGLKGKTIGGIMISLKQPNFLLNVKNGKAQDALALINIIKKSVVEKFGVILELEVQLVGPFTGR
ncbi:MAG: UDP-N-acetylenolpyruvoylglucosamine reductase [Parcubacteria group bacterium GW2011_GWA2_38_13b]|nr:MAG: UDP-N-acetylenolpyruvoylglucosamine reductase [Parcubacteria group bacterium GW2011_GWA2_38_13b]